jgi:hypothetical protein
MDSGTNTSRIALMRSVGVDLSRRESQAPILREPKFLENEKRNVGMKISESD